MGIVEGMSIDACFNQRRLSPCWRRKCQCGIINDHESSIRRKQLSDGILADEYYTLDYISSLNHKFKIIPRSSALLLVEDLVVGLLVDSVGDLLVVLVPEASLVSGVVNLCVYR